MTDLMDELILVTGANGFIGSHLTEALLARGYRVRCMVRRSSDLTSIRHLPVEWAYADVREPDSLRQACRDVSAVCHCAGLTRALDQETFLYVNSHGTEALAMACLELNPGLKRFLFVSSQTVAGPSRTADDYIDEQSPPRPLTWYGRSKWAAEQALHGLEPSLPLTIVRPSIVFGPRDVDLLVYFKLVKHGLSLKLGRRERQVCLIFVHDLVELLVLALEQDVAVGQTYFGSGPAHSYTDLSAAIGRALGRRTLCITVPELALTPIALCGRVWARVTGQPALLNEQRVLDMRQPYWLCSGDKARRGLGFVPQTDLDTAVRQTVTWYLENKWL